MKNLSAIHQFLAENQWTSRFWLDKDVSASNEAGVDILLLKEVALIRDSGQPQLSLALISVARDNGFDSPWLLENQARAYIKLSQSTKAYAIWRDLVLESNDPALQQGCVRALCNFRAYDSLASIDCQWTRSSLSALESGLAVVTDLLNKKDWSSAQTAVDSLTRQLFIHPLISYNRALACHGLGETSTCLMICDSLLKDDGLGDESLKAKIEGLEKAIRQDQSLHYDIDEYLEKLRISFARFGWRPVHVNLNEKNIIALNRDVVREAIAVRDSGLNQLSLAILNLVLLYEPKNPWALENKARALCLLGDFQEAMQLCRGILQSYPKHRAKESALSMLEKYDREFRLKTIYAEVARLSALGSEKRQDAMRQLQESFAVGYSPEGLQLMKRLLEAEHAKAEHVRDESHPALASAWIDLHSRAEVNQGLAQPATEL